MEGEGCWDKGVVGPFPYAVGMLQVLSRELAVWMVERKEFKYFAKRATAAADPSQPMMLEGEDMVIGMFIYISPFPVMPLHWGWDKLHDLCFECHQV